MLLVFRLSDLISDCCRLVWLTGLLWFRIWWFWVVFALRVLLGVYACFFGVFGLVYAANFRLGFG